MGTIVNIFLPGLGQLVQGRLFIGLLTLFIGMPLCALGYLAFFLPGLLIHLVLLIDAYQYDRKTSAQQSADAVFRALDKMNR